MKLFIAALLSVVCFNVSVVAQKADSIKLLIDSALNVMEHHSVHSSQINWKELRDSVSMMAKDASTTAEAAPAIKYAFNRLTDKHGWLVLNDTDYRNPAFKPDTARVNNDMKSAASKGGKVYVGQVAKDYAYISVPWFGGQTLDKCNAFAQKLQDSLCKVVTPATKGFIIDLRLNMGGNTFPMVVGLSNVFGNQSPAKTGYAGDWKIKDYSLQMNDTFIIRLSKNCGDYSKYPVAIIIGPQTASAGEYLALGFTARPNTILVGERTAGYTSGNNGFYLPGKNNAIVIAEDYAKGKDGKVYENGIFPQVEVVGGDDFFNREKDLKILAAVKWLRKQKVRKG